MPLTPLQTLAVVLTVAGVTVLCRALPFLLFRDGRPVSGRVIYLGRVVPYAIIAILVVYCLRSIDLFSASHGLPELLCVAVCALLHLWRRNELLSIFGSTALYMLLVQVVFP